MSILSDQVCMKIDNLNIPISYKDGINEAYKYIDQNVKNIKYISLMGSCAREQVTDGFSDIDLFIIADDENISLQEFKRQCWGLHDLKFDFNIASTKQIENVRNNISKENFHYYICYQLNQGLFKHLYNENYNLPKPTFNQYALTLNNQYINEGIEQVEGEIKVITDSYQSFKTPIKHIFSLMKLMLVAREKQLVEGYDDVHTQFYNSTGKNFPEFIKMSDLTKANKNNSINLEELKNSCEHWLNHAKLSQLNIVG